MGSSPYGPGTNCVRWSFVICNFVFMALGTITTGIGIWGLVIGTQGDYDVITGNNTISAAAVLLAAGGITLVVAGIGICGAWGMWRLALVIYTVAVLVIIILEVVAAVIALAFVTNDTITNKLESNMERAIRDYRVKRSDEDFQEDTNNAVNNVQQTFKCCGVESSEDWFDLNPNAVADNNNIPPGHCSCDLTDSKCQTFMVTVKDNITQYNAWKDGCISLLEKNIKTIMSVIGVVAIVLALIEAFLMVFATGLCCCIWTVHRKGTR